MLPNKGSRTRGLKPSQRSPDGAAKTPRPEPPGRTRYGGPWFSAASTLPFIGDAIGLRSTARLIAASLRRPRRLVALIALLARTPTEYVALSGTSAGQALNDYFRQRSLRVVPRKRFCRGVLLLPRDHADYLRGRRRQALRTNLQRAVTAGVQCEVAKDPWRAVDDISHVLRRRWDFLSEAELQVRLQEISAFVSRSDVTVVIARDQGRWPLAVAAVLIDDSVCLIKHAVATSHEARWALHDHLVRLLIARRVRCLLADGGGPFGALGVDSNVQHYQHLLGYELRHVVPLGKRRATRRWRLAVSVAVVTAAFAAIVPRAAARPATRTALDRAMQRPVCTARSQIGHDLQAPVHAPRRKHRLDVG